MDSERKHWKHLYSEIVATEICCGCSACVVACPHRVLELRDFDPIQTDANSPFDNCVHGEEGCSLCAMACLRLGPALDIIEPAVNGRRRDEGEVEGPYRYKTLARATDERFLNRGQDGGAVSALLAWGFDTARLDGAVVSAPSKTVPWLDEPRLVRDTDELLAAAGVGPDRCAALRAAGVVA